MFTNIIEVDTIYVDIEEDLNRRVNQTLIKKHLRRPFMLGENGILKRQVFFNVYKVENASNVYEHSITSNEMKIHSKISNEIIDSESSQKFIATVDKTVIFPKVLSKKLFGFENIEKQLMRHINAEENFIICLTSPEGYGKKRFLKHLEHKFDGKLFCTISHERMRLEEDYLMEMWKTLETIKEDIILCIPDINEFEEHDQILLTKMARSLQGHEGTSINVIMTTSDLKFQSSIIDHRIVVPSLSDSEKADLIACLVGAATDDTDSAFTNPNDELIAGLSGYSAKNIVEFVGKVSHHEEPLTMDLLIRCSRDTEYLPSHMQHFVSNEVTTSWADIGGYSAIKTQLQNCIVKPLISRRPLYSGVLLYGPPGCSKTMFARALATECNMKIFEVRPSTVMRSVVGETEAAVQAIMSRARAAAPSLLFVDEIETLLPARSAPGSRSVSDRLLSEFLTFLNGVSRHHEKVLFVAATNYIERLDAALVRTGRIDFKIEIGPPDQESRTAILKLELGRLEVVVSDSVWNCLNQIAQSLAGQSGSSIVDLCWQFQYRAMNEDRSANMDEIEITIDHVISVLGPAWIGLDSSC